MNLGANVIPDFIQTATYPDGIVSPADGGMISPGDTVDVVVDVNQSLIGRGPQSCYMTIDSDDPEEIEKIVNEIVDPVGTFYRFNLPSSLLGRRVS